MSRNLLPIALILTVTGLTGCASKPLPVLGEIPPFELLNQQGHKFDRSALEGHVWVADFIFTNCEGPCPRMTSRMHAIQKATGAGIKLVSFSVDPQRDTPQALAEYGKKFAADDARWTFLTGDPATLDMLDHDAFNYSLGDDNTVSRVTKDAARLEAETNG
jgi:cytochrome oxidase Cu insertion factor (SCO1/SenC/PrrC family)